MNYYVGYRRNQKGLETALDRLNLIETHLNKIRARNTHELMKANETSELVAIAKLTVRACMERKESGRTYFRRTDYPEINPDLNNPLTMWKEKGEPAFAWSA